MKKSALCWLRYAGADRDHPVWHVWHGGAAYVISGGPEQQLPGIDTVDEATVIARTKTTRQRLLAWRAAVSHLSPEDPQWAEIVDLLKSKRLNLRDTDNVAETWARDCVISRLTPTGELEEPADAMPDSDLARAPVPTPATTRGDLPWVIHKRQSRRPDLR
ncbi:MAG: hypothetical protein GEU93_01460 [Propionibacteriales bacterium]|nr:hypothetical protein [Propionibacteriales bacterium]